jgi:hypothetical protein
LEIISQLIDSAKEKILSSDACWTVFPLFSKKKDDETVSFAAVMFLDYGLYFIKEMKKFPASIKCIWLDYYRTRTSTAEPRCGQIEKLN